MSQFVLTTNYEPKTTNYELIVGDVRHSLASIKILKERLGLNHLISFSEGLQRLINLELKTQNYKL